MRLTGRFRVGMRVVVRHRIGEQATDALGDIVELTAQTVTVRTRKHGDVRIAWDAVVVAKPVPPAPARRGRPHRAIGITDLQEVMVAGMPPLESAWLGRWLLRAAGGYTGRGNSLLPLGDPGMPTGEAVAAVEQWYAERNLAPAVQLFGPPGFDPADDELGRTLHRRGWQFDGLRVLVLTAEADAVCAAAGPTMAGRQSVITSRPSEAWWAGAADRARAHRGTADAIFERLETSAFLTTVDPGGGTLAAGRVTCGAGWAGLFEVLVQPRARRSGLARALVTAAAAWARDQGVRLLYLQVGADNTPAVALYESLGFTVHHEYYYAKLVAPTASRAPCSR